MQVELLRCVRPPEAGRDEVFLGQFTAGQGERGYLDDDTVPTGSRCPTFAACVLSVDNDRWRGLCTLGRAHRHHSLRGACRQCRKGRVYSRQGPPAPYASRGLERAHQRHLSLSVRPLAP